MTQQASHDLFTDASKHPRSTTGTHAAIEHQPRITEPGYGKGRTPGNAGKTYPPEPLTTTEILRVLDACGGGKTGTRNRALIVILWRAGLRIHEALLLKPHHVDHDNGTVTVLRGKGGKPRIVGIDQWGRDEIRKWVIMHARVIADPDAPLFCTVSGPGAGGRLHQSYAQRLCRQLRVKAVVTKRVHPHGFRHAFACELMREGVALSFIQQGLGHSSPATTGIYLVGLGAGEAITAVASRQAPGGVA